MNNILAKLENWIKKNHKSSKHLIRTGFWLKRIYSKADETMMIAAIAHDFERAFPLRDNETKIENNGSKEYLLWHGKRSAEFLGEFLRENNASEELISKVKELVIYHELGGDEEKDAIMNADSISFLENKTDEFLKSIPQRHTKKEIKRKFDFMFNRISSEKAKKLAKPFYDKAMGKLNLTF